MFAVATFRSRKLTDRVVVPATAIMRLHDKDWVFRKERRQTAFARSWFRPTALAPDGMQEIREGVKAGDELVTNALEFSTEVAEKKAGMIRDPCIDFALRNRLLILGGALVLFVWGIISFHALPIEAYPDVADTYAQVITQWPGHAAEEVEQQITVPLEVRTERCRSSHASSLGFA